MLRSLQQVYGASTTPRQTTTVLWGDNEGTVVMVWDGMIQEEQVIAPKIAGLARVDVILLVHCISPVQQYILRPKSRAPIRY